MTVLEAVDCVVVKIGVPVGDPWVISEPGTRQQKDGRKSGKKQTILHQFFLQQPGNQQSINNQSDIQQSGKMDFADVNDA